MQARIDYFAAAPAALQPLLKLEQSFAGNGIEHGLIELIKLRASQIHGCAFCLHMHTQDARAAGESEARIYLLSAWRESNLYTARERAALAWTEALTLIAASHAGDTDYALFSAAFSEEEQVKISLVIGAINVWNRLAVGFRAIHPNDLDYAPR
ncbi:MAG: carboxymuconolactone decarboxylase family protein [Telluria sp.]